MKLMEVNVLEAYKRRRLNESFELGWNGLNMLEVNVDCLSVYYKSAFYFSFR